MIQECNKALAPEALSLLASKEFGREALTTHVILSSHLWCNELNMAHCGEGFH